MRLITVPLALALCALALPVHAYVGPGLGLGAIGALFGILFAVLLAIVGIFWYPLKRLFKGKDSDDLEQAELADGAVVTAEAAEVPAATEQKKAENP